jgi:hypothetical protein
VSYFCARVGGRETQDQDAQVQGRSTKEMEPKTATWEPTPCFTSQTGSHPNTVGKIASKVEENQHSIPNIQYPISNTQYPTPTCPLCRGSLAKEDGLYHCQGRCGAHWLEESPGYLVDLAALPYGVCACCKEPRALVKSDNGAVCPLSGRAYLLLPDGVPFLADATPHGVCQCCVPPIPLVRHDGDLVCQAKPQNRYHDAGDQVTLLPTSKPTATPAETLAAIDAALRRNSARVTVNGLFDVE